jgi:hypothetical protein
MAMSDLSRFEQLARRARQESPPTIDVSADVLATVRVSASQSVPTIDRWAVAFAAASVLAASIVAMIAWQLIEEPMVAEVPNPFVVPVMMSQ